MLSKRVGSQSSVIVPTPFDIAWWARCRSFCAENALLSGNGTKPETKNQIAPTLNFKANCDASLPCSGGSLFALQCDQYIMHFFSRVN